MDIEEFYTNCQHWLFSIETFKADLFIKYYIQRELGTTCVLEGWKESKLLIRTSIDYRVNDSGVHISPFVFKHLNSKKSLMQTYRWLTCNNKIETFAMLEQFCRISLYLTNDAIAKLYRSRKFSSNRGKLSKFRHIELSTKQ